VSIEFWLGFEPHIPLTRLAINFLFITARAERKDRFCVKLIDFFSKMNTHPLNLNLSRFVPYSVQEPTWNFRRKLFRDNFSEILCKPRLYSTEIVKFCKRGILVWNFFQTFFTVSIEFWVGFEPQIPPTSLTINFLFITAWTERKYRLCVKVFDFFRRWILHGLTWNLSRFVPNSVEVPTWNFRKKLFRKNFSEILCKPRLSSNETCEILPYVLQFFSRSVFHWKNSHKYFHMVFAPR